MSAFRSSPAKPRSPDFSLRTEVFSPDDLLACARSAGLKTRRAREVIAEVAAALRRWPDFAAPAGVPADWTRRVAATHRLTLALA